MAELLAIEEEEEEEEEGTSGCVQESAPNAAPVASVSRKEKRKAVKREKRKQTRKELAEKARAEQEARLNDPEEQRRIQLEEERENERLERERSEFEERERLFLEELARKRAEEDEEEERRRSLEEESKQNQAGFENELNEDDDWEYVEEGPPEIIWQGNEIIVKKKRVRVKKKDPDKETKKEDTDRPTSNPLPPQSEAFSDYKNAPMVSAQQLLENVAQQVPNFGTEQDKAHCPFHIKTGACRFGSRCSRVHFYPDKSCTLLFKNMYNGPGLAWEQDEGLENPSQDSLQWRFTVLGLVGSETKDIINSYTDEEAERCYEEFYEDVHTELLKFGEIVNFKVCRNGSFHLRGNVYVHYKSLDSSVLAYHSINGRYFAGKQVNCEYVSVTRWKVAICGEYMKSRLKTCSRGTACNFIHCFRNPGGDYEWADWDKPPPKYWVRKMTALFGYSDESGYEKQIEQEGLGQRRNSSKMLTAERDRYYSRRSRSRERDYLNGSSSRSRYEEPAVRKSTTRQRHTSDGRKHLRTPDEKNHDEERKSKKGGTCDTDSDGDWSDRGRDRDKYHDSSRKSSRHRIKVTESGESRRGSKRTRESDSDDDRDRHHGPTRKCSRHQEKVSEIPDDYGDSKNRTHDSNSGGDWLDKERERGRHHRDRRKSSRHQKKVFESPNDYWNSNEDCSDGDGDRHHNHTRESSRNSNEFSGFSNDHYESESILNNKVHGRESDQSKVELQRFQTRSHSSRRDRPSVETSEADFLGEHVKSSGNRETTNSDRYNQRVKPHDLESRYDTSENVEKLGRIESEDEFPRKREKSRRKLNSNENVESGSPDRYNRNELHDSGYYPDENADEIGRWEPENFVTEKKQRSRTELDDRKQYKLKSKSRDQTADECYGESRLRGSSLSTHGKHTDNLDETDNVEELQESEDYSKRYKEKHRINGHKRHKKQSS